MNRGEIPMCGVRNYPLFALSEYSLSERVGLFAAAGGLRNVRPVFDILNLFNQERGGAICSTTIKPLS